MSIEGNISAHPAIRMRHRLLGRRTAIIAWIILLVAVLHPPHETGISLCWMNATTGVPCPGCGMTRSVSAIARGDFMKSVEYHAFGPLLLAISTLAAAATLFPRLKRRTIDRCAERYSHSLNVLFWVGIAAFVSYGVIRAVPHFLRLIAPTVP